MTEFIDLMPQLAATTENNKNLSPHEAARQFVLEVGSARGGKEVIVVADKQGRFLGAGTQNLPAAVDFPPSIQELLSDPKANLTVHHNHPPTDEPFFSKTDIIGIRDNCGIGWLLMHNDKGYMAIRVRDTMFVPDASGKRPVDGLASAYETGQRIAQYEIFRRGLKLDTDVMESLAAELALQALEQVGAIEHYSSLGTDVSHELKQDIIQQIRSQSSTKPEQSGGAAIWSGTKSTALPGTSGGMPNISGNAPVYDPSSNQIEFERFVEILSRQNLTPHDPTEAGRPKPPQLPETGGGHSGLASRRPTGRPFLESGLISTHKP